MKPGASQAPSGRTCVDTADRQFGPGLELRDAAPLDHDGAIMVQVRTVEDGTGHDRVLVRSAHRVRVTFRRWRGRSTSVPSRCARLMSIA